MSDFYSRCLVCRIDLPRGVPFCTREHALLWQDSHPDVKWPPTPAVYTDCIGNADVREQAVSVGEPSGEMVSPSSNQKRVDPSGLSAGTVTPHRGCEHPHCRLAF